MLKKTALSLFGLVVMLICINPPQAHAGVVVSFGPVYRRPYYVSILLPGSSIASLRDAGPTGGGNKL
jgi:hypothetical protein